MLTAKDISEYFIYKASIDEDIITNLKIQKLLYYTQGFSLAMFDAPVFKEAIQKWTHGPVIPEIYHLYKEHGAGAIPSIEKIDYTKYGEKIVGLLDEIYSVYGQFSGWALRDMTHQEPPWLNTPDGQEISLDLMKEYFKTRIA